MAIVVSDSFTDTAGTSLASHAGEAGATWTLHPTADGTAAITAAGRLRFNGPNSAVGSYTASGVPPTAEYDVSADLHFASVDASHNGGPLGRASTAVESWYAVYLENGASPSLQLWKAVAGTWTLLGSYAITRTAGLTYAIKLELRDAAKKVYVDGVPQISSTDNVVTAAGRAGLYLSSASTPTDSTGIHWDNFLADDLSAPAGGVGLVGPGLCGANPLAFVLPGGLAS